MKFDIGGGGVVVVGGVPKPYWYFAHLYEFRKPGSESLVWTMGGRAKAGDTSTTGRELKAELRLEIAAHSPHKSLP